MVPDLQMHLPICANVRQKLVPDLRVHAPDLRKFAAAATGARPAGARPCPAGPATQEVCPHNGTFCRL
eukprot:6763924-Pyramimonas_sp.AAC.1